MKPPNNYALNNYLKEYNKVGEKRLKENTRKLENNKLYRTYSWQTWKNTHN